MIWFIVEVSQSCTEIGQGRDSSDRQAHLKKNGEHAIDVQLYDAEGANRADGLTSRTMNGMS